MGNELRMIERRGLTGFLAFSFYFPQDWEGWEMFQLYNCYCRAIYANSEIIVSRDMPNGLSVFGNPESD
jgi:hypothetical protein